ncbi:alanine or glycine:cation symporter, AGCS family [Desulfonispora thiosulfatigenes DSM 11270]|uniref:Alanine or glycine:cation symporter, AGCS family n=1 Tax=Desulfonispora thiosulfatigenes DSM 11270 TaxID=656914 RepID=A0A1W1V1N5_DESTI|nr:sodium:alanine symporter family protein [Desulfonispora thiosulfatigenes]SMB87287.1 alanine or glycine:cation symporter, AGCS family [Desulfonispora thiosulfatigenes DSM 11270]
MDQFTQIAVAVSNFAWGPIMVSLLVGTGLYLTLGTGVIQIRKLFVSLKLLFTNTKTTGEGDISPFAALMTSLASTIGTGNIAGVSTAITFGGPGAIFWMWITAAVGGATQFAEAVLSITYRETNEWGFKSGGPMYYIKNGLGKRWYWLGAVFAFFGLIACFGPGTLVQANSLAEVVNSSWGVSPWITGSVIAVATGLVLIGGIKSIGSVAGKVVPVMSLVYIVGALVILAFNVDKIPHAFGMIFESAFSGHAVQGGLLGTIIRYGVSRGVFSNEAGLGTGAIAHGAASTSDPVKQGLIGSLGAFIDTIVVCTMTALVILTSPFVNIGPDGIMQLLASDGAMYPVSMRADLAAQGIDFITGAALTSQAFHVGLPGPGDLLILFGLVFFSYSTILGWYYYGAKCLEYLVGLRGVNLYKWLWVAMCLVGAVIKLDIVWAVSDAFNGLMIIPNLIALVLLSPIVFKVVRRYDFKNMKMDDSKEMQELLKFKS